MMDGGSVHAPSTAAHSAVDPRANTHTPRRGRPVLLSRWRSPDPHSTPNPQSKPLNTHSQAPGARTRSVPWPFGGGLKPTHKVVVVLDRPVGRRVRSIPSPPDRLTASSGGASHRGRRVSWTSTSSRRRWRRWVCDDWWESIGTGIHMGRTNVERGVEVNRRVGRRPSMNSTTYSSIPFHANESITGAALRQVCGQVRCGLQGAQPYRAQEQGGQSDYLSLDPCPLPYPIDLTFTYTKHRSQESIDVLMKRFYTMPLPKGGGVVHVRSQHATQPGNPPRP